MGTRKLLREGLLLKAKSGRRLRGFLCSDILVLTDEAAKSLYRTVRVLACPLYATLIQLRHSPSHYPKLRSEKHQAVEVRRPLFTIDYPDGPACLDDLAFQIVLAYPRGGDKINLKATSARDCQLWMQAIDRARQDCRKAEMRAAQRRHQ